jgi:hypothetical protein
MKAVGGSTSGLGIGIGLGSRPAGPTINRNPANNRPAAGAVKPGVGGSLPGGFGARPGPPAPQRGLGLPGGQTDNAINRAGPGLGMPGSAIGGPPPRDTILRPAPGGGPKGPNNPPMLPGGFGLRAGPLPGKQGMPPSFGSMLHPGGQNQGPQRRSEEDMHAERREQEPHEMAGEHWEWNVHCICR